MLRIHERDDASISHALNSHIYENARRGDEKIGAAVEQFACKPIYKSGYCMRVCVGTTFLWCQFKREKKI